MKTVIYCRGQSSMQSGKARSHEWVLESEVKPEARPDPVTGWHGGERPHQRLVFKSQAQAEAYARAQGLNYTLRPETKKQRIIKSYADNFAHSRVRAWTH